MMGAPEAVPILEEVVRGQQLLHGPNAAETLLAKVSLIAAYVDGAEHGKILAMMPELNTAIEALQGTRLGELGRLTVQFQIEYLRANAKDNPLGDVFSRGALDSMRAMLDTVEKKQLIPPDHALMGLLRYELARLLLKNGREKEADELFVRVLADARHTTGLAHPKAVHILVAYSDRLAEQKRLPDARALYDEFEKANVERFTPENPWRTQILLKRVCFEEKHGSRDAALKIAKEALRLADSGHVVRGRMFGADLHNAAFELAQGQGEKPAVIDTARRLLDHDYAIVRSCFGEVSPEMTILLSNHGDIIYSAGDQAGGYAKIREAEALLGKLTKPMPGQTHYDLLTRLGSVAHDRGRFAEAEGYFRKALPLARSLEAWAQSNVSAKLASVLCEQRRYADALPCFRDARAAAVREKEPEKVLALIDLNAAAARLATGDRAGYDAAVTTMAKAYGSSQNLDTLNRLAWAAGIARGGMVIDPAALAARIAPKLTTFEWGYRGLALLHLRAGNLKAIEPALAKGGKDQPSSEAIRGLAAVRANDHDAARKHLGRAAQLIEAAKPSEKNPFAYAGTTWHFRMETEILLAELRDELRPREKK
jgi:tetratricopeptide (TPR) repeat protein